MTLPPIPTDNLYKFLALAGLVTVLFSIGYPMSQLGPLRLRTFELLAEGEILRLELDNLGKEVAAAERKPRPLEELHAMRRRHTELAVKQIQLTSKENQLIALTSELTSLVGLLRGGAAVGTFLVVIGFSLWYFRVQKPQDSLLRRQSEDAKPPVDRGGSP